MLSLKHYSYLVIFFLFIVLFTNPSHSLQISKGFPLCFKEDTDWTKTWCPLRGVKLGHRLFVVDFTSALQPNQETFIKDNAFGLSLIEETKPYHKISFVRIDHKSASEQKPFFMSCRMKTGEGYFEETLEGINQICEGNNVKAIYFNFKAALALTTDDYSLIEDANTGPLNYDKTIEIFATDRCLAIKKKMY